MHDARPTTDDLVKVATQSKDNQIRLTAKHEAEKLPEYPT